MLQKFKQPPVGYTEVYAWGDDEFGQLGVSGKKNSKNYSSPRCCSFNIVIHQISCGDQHSAFIASNGYIYSMGNNDEGRLGLSQRDIKYSYSPCLVESLSRHRACKVMCGWGHTIALVENGEVFTWGYGADGQLGNNNPNSQFTPQLVDFSHLNDSLRTVKAKDVACGGRHSFTIMENNKVCCFGCAEYGQLGTGSSNNEIIPCMVDTIYEDVIEIACGYAHSLFLTESHKVYATGNNSNGELGVGHKKTSFLPIKIMMLDSFHIERISASNHSCALTDKGDLYLWGPFTFGESIFPQKIIIKNKIQNVSLGNKFGICIDSAGYLYGWGNNNNGELGLGDYDPRNNINQIVTLQNKIIKDFSCGGNFIIALGNTVNKKIDEVLPEMNKPNKAINFQVTEGHQKNNSGVDYFESKKAKSQHNRSNHSLNDFREDAILNTFKNKNSNNIKYLTNEEIKTRQKASIYESPNRVTDKEFEYVPGANCDTQRTVASPYKNENNVNKHFSNNSKSDIKNKIDYKPKQIINNSNNNNNINSINNINNNPYQINISKNESDYSSNKNLLNFKKEKNNNDFNTLNRDIIKSRQFEYSTNKEYNYESSIGKNSSTLNIDVNDYYYRSKEKEKSDDLKTEKQGKITNNAYELNSNNHEINEIQQQQIELYQNNKREIELLRSDQMTLQEKYYKLEKNFFEIDDNLNAEKEKNAELQRLFEEERAQNRNYMKEISEREQMLEKIEFLNQVLQEKEQELLVIKGEIPKKEKFYEEGLRNMKFKYENQIKSLENELNGYAEQIDKLQHDFQTGNEEILKKNEFIQNLEEEKNVLLNKINKLEEIHKNDQMKIKKINQELNSLEEENNILKNLVDEKDNELQLLNKNLSDLNEKNEYYDNMKSRDQKKYEQTERELTSIQEKIIYLEKLSTQKDSEIEQLKQLIEENHQKNKRSAIPSEKPGIPTEKRHFESININRVYENYSTNDGNITSQDSFHKKDRSITPNPSIKKLERTDLNPTFDNNNNKGYNEYSKNSNIEMKNYRKEYQEHRIDNKDRAVINFNNSLNNSVVFNTNLHDIKSKLNDLQKNKNALEKRMQDFELRLKESKNK